MKNIYQNYDALQLAADEDFIRWVKYGTAEEEAAWRVWLEAHPEKRAEVAEAHSLVKSISFPSTPPKVDTDQLWNRIRADTRKPAAVKPIAGRRRFLFGIAGAVAAAGALVLFVIFGIDRPNRIDTAFEQHLVYTLPDQSRVNLNADTRLTYDDSGRRITLEGEAFFAVEKGDAFVVETTLGQVQVLGTQFNVFSREGRFRVQCTEGRVQVTAPSDREGVMLTAGTACRLDETGQLVLENLSGLETEVDWLQDIYRFKAEPLRVVFEEIERQFDVLIEADEAILSREHTGYFEGERLDSVLYQVCFPQNLQSTIKGNTVRITEADTE